METRKRVGCRMKMLRVDRMEGGKVQRQQDEMRVGVQECEKEWEDG